ncbi:MAG: hypothetical protein F6K19_38680 [Cyanothece sp. SIO1E1]|nr:hypothetical protein [Cyanothece sp. SIO1E1]
MQSGKTVKRVWQGVLLPGVLVTTIVGYAGLSAQAATEDAVQNTGVNNVKVLADMEINPGEASLLAQATTGATTSNTTDVVPEPEADLWEAARRSITDNPSGGTQAVQAIGEADADLTAQQEAGSLDEGVTTAQLEDAPLEGERGLERGLERPRRRFFGGGCGGFGGRFRSRSVFFR